MRFAVSRLHLPDGTILKNHVLVSKNGKIVDFFPLSQEICFTEWRGGDYYLSEDEKEFCHH